MCEEKTHPRDRGLEEKPDCGFGLTISTCIRIFPDFNICCLRVKILTLVTIGYSWIHSWDIFIEYCYGPKWPYWIYIAYIGLFGTGICRY